MISPPRVWAEARAYRYGAWAGHPHGTPYDGDRCAYEIMGVWHARGQCMRRPGHGPAGLYCRQHARRVAAREVRT